ncbi:MAG: hypothetical protein AAF446_10785 [Pseudomonadota bacterium]
MSIKDEDLDRRLRALPRTAEVDDALWSKIEHRIEGQTRHQRYAVVKWSGGIAAAVSLIAVAALFDLDSPNWSELHRSETIAAEVHAMNAANLLPQLAGQIEWSDDMRTAWNEYQSAIDELEAALELNPGYQMLIDTLVATRLRQSNLLNQAQSTRVINTRQTQELSEGVTSYEI